MRRPGTPLVAAGLVVLAALAGCTSGSGQHRHSSATVAELRARAAMTACPKPTSLAAATGTPTPTARATARPAPSGSGRPSGSAQASGPVVTSAEPTPQNLPSGTFACLAGGPPVPLHQLTGVPMVINLWATWCLPCRTELPAFQAAFSRADPDRLRVLGVATQDPGLSRELSFAVDTGLHMPNLVDDKGVVATQIGVRGLPATLFVGADGMLLHVYNGPPLTLAALRDLVRKYLRVSIG